MSASRAAIVAEARTWIGTPYRHQASLKGVGCDCLGLLRGVWGAAIGPEPEMAPPYTPDWAEAAGEEALLAVAERWLIPAPPGGIRSGDVLLFRWRDSLPAKHCAIAATAETMIHAHAGASVAEVAFAPWWRRHLAGAFAFPGVASTGAPPLPEGEGWGEGEHLSAGGAIRPAQRKGLAQF